MKVTGEIIKSAVSLKITGSLPAMPAFKIYKEATSQALTKPNFFISTIDVAQTRISKSSYERLYQMNIRYTVEQNTSKIVEVLEGMGNDLMGILNVIDVPIIDNVTTKPVNGIGLEYKVEENVLQFFVNYKIKVTPQVAAQPLMEELTININQ